MALKITPFLLLLAASSAKASMFNTRGIPYPEPRFVAWESLDGITKVLAAGVDCEYHVLTTGDWLHRQKTRSLTLLLLFTT